MTCMDGLTILSTIAFAHCDISKCGRASIQRRLASGLASPMFTTLSMFTDDDLACWSKVQVFTFTVHTTVLKRFEVVVVAWCWSWSWDCGIRWIFFADVPGAGGAGGYQPNFQ